MSKKEEYIEFKEVDIKSLDIPNCADEELHCLENDKYLVPIFVENGTVYRGNGVIVGKYLVTAAHVAQSVNEKENYSELSFVFQKQSHTISDKDIVFDGRGKEDEDGVHNDLIVYKLDEIESSFVNNIEEIEEGMRLASYPLNECDGCVEYRSGGCSIVSKEVFSFDKNEKFIWKNCFKVCFPWMIRHGDSGSPVFSKNVIYGILIEKCDEGESTRGIVLDARYIQQRIEEYAQ